MLRKVQAGLCNIKSNIVSLGKHFSMEQNITYCLYEDYENAEMFFPNPLPVKGIPRATETLQQLAREVTTPYLLLPLRNRQVVWHDNTFTRMRQVMENTGAVMLYSDYYNIKEGEELPCPTIEYQAGSLRDDFDFGAAVMIRTDIFRKVVSEMSTLFRYAALYDLRLRLSREGRILHLPEYLYSEQELDFRTSGEKQFDYVDPRNREVQLEMEAACTAHLEALGARLTPPFRKADLSLSFPVEASVIIPVRNREKTIAEAITSALSQETPYSFNILVVDNHSTDGTTAIVREWSQRDKRVLHLIPESNDLGIGGCWNYAVNHPACGKFAVQLDSDDLYASGDTLTQIIDRFYQGSYAMVIGSYQMVNFRLEEIPPGIIDHREWTTDNGPNNALRINGLGAPRAFYTPLIREVGFPNVSYGEDYAVALAISRNYAVGRIYAPIYLCRRWEGNSDANLDIAKVNSYNYYKDTIRTIELLTRINILK